MSFWNTYTNQVKIINNNVVENDINIVNDIDLLNFEILLGTGRIKMHEWNFDKNNKFYKTSSYRILMKFKTLFLINDLSINLKLIDNNNKILDENILNIYDININKYNNSEIEYNSKIYFNIISHKHNKYEKNKNFFKILITININKINKYYSISPIFYIYSKKPKNTYENIELLYDKFINRYSSNFINENNLNTNNNNFNNNNNSLKLTNNNNLIIIIIH
jgi:hypothetical protein